MKRFVTGLFAFLMAAALFAQSDLQVLAVVKLNKAESITVKQLKSKVGMYEKQRGAALTVDDREKVLDSIIQEKLILQAAAKAGISLPDSAVDQLFLEQVSQQLAGRLLSQSELETLVKQQTGLTLDEFLRQQIGMSADEYKLYLKNQTIARQYVITQRQSELKDAVPTDEEIRAFYELNKMSFVWTDMFKMFLVVFPKGNNAEAARTLADSYYNKLKSKKLTANQITVESKKENSGFQAGEVIINKTQVSAQQLGMTYEDLLTLFNKDVGYISSLEEQETHFQFYTIVKKYEAKMLGLSDIVQPDNTYTVYDYIRQNLSQQKQVEYLANAVQEIAENLDTDANVERKKSGDALKKLLSW